MAGAPDPHARRRSDDMRPPEDRHPVRMSHRFPRLVAAVLGMAVASVSVVVLFAGCGRAAKTAQARVTIGPSAKLTSVPDSFLGVSTEVGALALFERHGV